MRTSVTLTKPQTAFVKKEAARLGISMADMVRRIIDTYREGKSNGQGLG